MKKTTVFQLGLRGIPNVQGGIETHVEHLAPLLAKLGHDVTVLGRKPYQPNLPDNEYKQVKVKALWSPKNKGYEALIHTFIGVCYSIVKRPDIIHIHAVGPSLLVPLARLFGLKVVITHHGPDYDRQKWGRFAKAVLQQGESWGARYANQVISISKTIYTLVERKYSVTTSIIPNGVVAPAKSEGTQTLEKFGLTKQKYILIVSRLVPEKRHLDLIEAFERAQIKDWKLVIVGSSDHPDAYSNQVMSKGQDSNGTIVTTGFQSGAGLTELFTEAGVFVLPSSHEGLPIAMLEALSYGLPVIASNIPANLEVDLIYGEFFELGDVEKLTQLLIKYTSTELTAEIKKQIIKQVIAKYNWEKIAKSTSEVYQKLSR